MQRDEVKWLEPWYGIGPGLEVELQREVGPGHLLFGVRATAVARRSDCDDVLFALLGFQQPLAVVHLTWSTSSPEANPAFPATTLYPSLEAWIELCMKPANKEVTT